MSKTTKPKSEAAKKILVVEDDGEMSLVLDMILDEKKLQLDYVHNLLSAGEYLQKEEPSLIILDNLPQPCLHSQLRKSKTRRPS